MMRVSNFYPLVYVREKDIRNDTQKQKDQGKSYTFYKENNKFVLCWPSFFALINGVLREYAKKKWKNKPRGGKKTGAH